MIPWSARCFASASTSTRAPARLTRPSRPSRSSLPARRRRLPCRWAATAPDPGARLVLLVSANSRISVYDATYGTPLGSFATSPGINALASTDTVTVAGDTTVPSPLQLGTNQLQMIDVAASLSSRRGHAAFGQFEQLHAAQRLHRAARPLGLARLEPGLRLDGGNLQFVHAHAVRSRPLDGGNLTGIAHCRLAVSC